MEEKLNDKETKKVFATGFKGFDPDMKCRDKQYAENTVFEEDSAEICHCGMHFCENPLDVLDYYPLLGSDCKLNEFARVEALAKAKTEDRKSVTTKLEIGVKLGLKGFVKAAVKFSLEWLKKVDFNKGDTAASGEYSQLAASGEYSKLAASGDNSKLAASGEYSQLAASGDNSQLAASGEYSKLAASGEYSQLAASGEYSKLAASGEYSQLAASGYNSQLAASGEYSQLAASGDNSQLAASGEYSKLAASGDNSQLAASGEYSKLAASGEYSQLAASGYNSQLAASGYNSQLAASGDNSKLAASGDNCLVEATGEECVIAATGINSKVKGAIGCFIACAEWKQDNNGKWHPVSFKTAKVDGKKIKANTWYTVRGGKFVEVSDDK